MNTTEDDRRSPIDATVPAHVEAAFTELDAQYTREVAGLARPGTDVQRAEHSARLALICARRAGWWRVLVRHGFRAGMPGLYGLAVIKAGGSERDDARFWRDTAVDWRARAEHRPTSDAAGALSNWHELGVLGMSTPTAITGHGWRQDAACALVDAEIFYPLDLDPTGPAVAAARRVCTGCPVRPACLLEVMGGEDPARRWGITAGLTPNERGELFARQRATITAPGAVAA